MVKHNTVARRFNPVRSKKRRSRRRNKSRYSERTKTDQSYDRCVTITLKDVGDIDHKELNTIPSSVQGETSCWGDNLEDKSNENSFASYTNPLLQIQSVDFCQLCTKKLIDVHEKDVDGTGDVCNHEGNGDDGRRQHVAQSIMKVFRSITEGRFDGSQVNVAQTRAQSKMSAEQERENSEVRARLMEKKCRTLSKAMNTSNKEIAKCSLSRVSVQVMCTSESTLSTALTQEPNPVVLWPPHAKPNSESSTTKKKLETVAGALLMELCKVTAEKIDKETPTASQKKLLLAKDSYLIRLKNAKHGRPTTGYPALDARFPEWLRELCQEDDLKKPKRGILKKARSQIEKSKIKIFRPLLCTKLSIPWMLPKSLSQIVCKKQRELNMLKQKSSSVVKHDKNQHQRSNKDRARESKKEHSNDSARRNSKCSVPVDTKVVHVYNTRSVHYRSSDSVVPFEGPQVPAEVPLRLFASKTTREVKPTKKKRAEHTEDSTEDRVSQRYSNSNQETRDGDRLKEKRVKEVCPKCQSSIQCSISLRRNSPKLRKIKTKAHNVLAYPCKKIVKKTKPTSRQEKTVRQQLERARENGKTRQHNRDPTTKYFIKSFFTGTSTSETTKPPIKTIKKAGRRKKIGVPPRMPGRSIPHDAKKRRASPRSRSPRRHHGKIDKEDSTSDIELEIQASEEMDIINQHIKAHKTASGSSPVFHTCFKRLLDKELKAQSGRDSKTSRSHKISKGGYFFGRPPPEVKRFNEGIFSCLIPKVFK